MFLNRELIKVLTITINQVFLLKMQLLTFLVDLVKMLPLKNNTPNKEVEQILAAVETILPRVELIKLILMPQELITTKLLILQPITTSQLLILQPITTKLVILQLTMTITIMEENPQILIKLELEMLEHQLIPLKS